jgi:cell division protein FtsI/penicillin-binding protein 2
VFPLVAVVVVAMLAAAGGAVGYLFLRTAGTPAQAAASYLTGWQRRDYPAMNAVSTDLPSGGVAGPLTTAAQQVGLRRLRVHPGPVATSGSHATERFTAAATLAGGQQWGYRGQLGLVKQDRHWRVRWSPGNIYPGLRAGQRFTQSYAWPARAQVLGADGSAISSSQALSKSGSLALLTGGLVAATTSQAQKLGPPYRKGDDIGSGGIEQAYEKQLAGKPALTIKIAGPGSQAGHIVAGFKPTPGQPVKTSIDLRDQVAASAAVSKARTSKPVDLVALQPSTGRVLAVVERPGGEDRALEGQFPPGSTFKVVTASALAERGLRPSSRVQCPSHITVDGRVIHNDNNEHLGSTTLTKAFAASCNTTFAQLATQRLSGRQLASMAASLGVGARPALGIAAYLGAFTTPHDQVDLAADAYGQGKDLVSPLSQAALAGAMSSGTWRPPLLVVSPAPHRRAAPQAVSRTILDTLRPMMRAVVTSGTAAGVGFPPGVHGKTGTAQYGTGAHSHGWFIGYRGDLAFAVLVEGGGTGADSAGPVANAFLRRL